jgi:hypothetical protein
VLTSREACKGRESILLWWRQSDGMLQQRWQVVHEGRQDCGILLRELWQGQDRIRLLWQGLQRRVLLEKDRSGYELLRSGNSQLALK